MLHSHVIDREINSQLDNRFYRVINGDYHAENSNICFSYHVILSPILLYFNHDFTGL